MKQKLIISSAILADCILIHTAICLGFFTKFHGVPQPVHVNIFFYLSPLITVIHLITLALFQLYKLDQDRYPFDIIYNTFWAVTISWLFSFLIMLVSRTYFFPTANISRGLLLYNWLWTIVLLSSWRILYYRIERARGSFISRVAIISSGRLGQEIMDEMKDYAKYGHQVLGIIDAEITPSNGEPSMPMLGKISKLHELVSQLKITELIIAVTGVAPNDLLRLISLCENIGARVKVKVLPSLYEVTVGRITLQETAGIPLIEIKSHAFSGVYPVIKRFLDIVVSLGALVVLLIPFCIIALLIKLTSSGPVFYRQQRVGKDGKQFMLYKFRTMVKNAEDLTGPVLATLNDPRITRFGAILRKTRIDEFPQLLNILKGDMSLVGPRPERPEFVKKFYQFEPFYSRRLKVRPGLTGLAQIHGRYDTSVENKLRYDLAYVYNISLMLDLKIIFSTIRVVLTGKGAR
ncbi:MAG: sugar transferase [bacterium]|nr:sugar transferase [bacterium]